MCFFNSSRMQGCFEAIQKKYVSHIQPFTQVFFFLDICLIESLWIRLYNNDNHQGKSLSYFFFCLIITNVVQVIVIFPSPAADSHYVCEYFVNLWLLMCRHFEFLTNTLEWGADVLQPLIFSIRPESFTFGSFLDLHWPREPRGNAQVVLLPWLMFNNAKLLYR